MTKLKRMAPRTATDGEEPPETRRPRRQRLASEPTSHRMRMSDRWEPGFLRLPPGPMVRGLSYVVDALGIYYDATAPNELEVRLEEGGWQTDELMRRADAGMAELRRRRLSLDNDPRRTSLAEALLRVGAGPESVPENRVVVVDQGRSDAAIGFALAGPARFRAMLDAARDENPDAELVVVMDPSASYGTEPGHLDSYARTRNARVVREPVQAWSVVEGCRRLYVVATHVGFEAASVGRPVTCFGTTFYSGWGFTDDRLRTPRRSNRRSPAEVFAAAYLLYSRYFDPYTGQGCRFEDAVEILDLITARQRENAVRTVCLGFAPWKRPWLMRALGAPGHPPIMSNAARVAPRDLTGAARAVAWASRMPPTAEAACKAAGVPIVRMEDGFLRSVGLGVGLRPGASYVLDRLGIYYDASGPSDLEALLEAGGFGPDLLARAARLREAIVAAGVSKYNVGSRGLPPMPDDRPVVLVGGQVEDDASIRRGAVEVAGNAGLLRRARELNPGATIVYKPHPDVEAGLRPGQVPAADLARLADVVIRDVSAPAAIAAADRVEVASSLIGFEALLRGKPVRTHGLPFYAGWGLTEGPTSPRRTRRLTLDELVAGALILYPRYLDPVTSLPCGPETVVARLATGDPGLTRRERTVEGYLKQAWSLAWRLAQRERA